MAYRATSAAEPRLNAKSCGRGQCLPCPQAIAGTASMPWGALPAWRSLAAAGALGAAAFCFATGETLPVGLLPVVSASLRSSLPATGLLVTVYAVVAPRGTGMASAVPSSVCNAGIATGPVIGGLVLSGPGLRITALAGGCWPAGRWHWSCAHHGDRDRVIPATGAAHTTNRVFGRNRTRCRAFTISSPLYRSRRYHATTSLRPRVPLLRHQQRRKQPHRANE